MNSTSKIKESDEGILFEEGHIVTQTAENFNSKFKSRVKSSTHRTRSREGFRYNG